MSCAWSWTRPRPVGCSSALRSVHRCWGADTAVVVDDRILGKPRDRADAVAMLLRLAGRTHRVLSGVALVGAGEERALSVSEVHFRAISAREEEAYWESGGPRDKAGGYASRVSAPYSWRSCGVVIRG